VPDIRMTIEHIVNRRLYSTRLAGRPLRSAEDVVRWLCAVQSQDFGAAKWAIAQRTSGVSDGDVDKLFNDGALVRTHVLRPTWHFVMPADIRWMLKLTAPRVRAAMAFYDRQLGIDDAVVARSNAALLDALQGGSQLTRAEIADVYRKANINAEGLRAGHLLMRAELDGVVCSGGLRGKQFTYALLDERVPPGSTFDRDAALAELAARYFASHGPAQVADFAWWSGLTVTMARSAAEMARPSLASTTVDGTVYLSADGPRPATLRSPHVRLLSTFDEYLVGYTDRSAHYDAALFTPTPAGISLLANSIVIDGRIVGGWRRTVGRDGITITTRVVTELTAAQREALERVAERYSRFMGKPVTIVAERAD
jgi:hypothetical protein